jgi:hypothetical protein
MRKFSISGLTLLCSTGVLAAIAEPAVLTEAQRHALAAKSEVWQPVPAVVSAPAGQPPSDAQLLLGADLSQWRAVNGGGPVGWRYQEGILTVEPGSGDIQTLDNFCDIQLHLEWRAPAPLPGKAGQLRNNSGIFLQNKYEIQILDSYQNDTYPNGQAGSVYKQTIPLVNAMRPTGQWQSYDIIYKAPVFNGDQLASPAYVTVLHNGVLIQNHTAIPGTTEWIGPPQVQPHSCAPLKLQDHGDLVSFRNIWVRRLNKN